MGKIKMGNVRSVENKDPRPNANSNYMALWVEDENGDNERCLFFRESDFLKIPSVSFPETLGIEKKMKSGRLYGISYGITKIFVVKTDIDGEEKVLKLTERKIGQAEALASSNKEDIPDRGFLNDMID